MAARPAKRQKRPVVVVLPSSSEDESTFETVQTRIDGALDPVSSNISSEKLSLSLPSRTRSGKIRTRPPVAQQQSSSSTKTKRTKKSDSEPSETRAIHTFFTASIEQARSKQEIVDFDAAELEDLIEDDAICEEELRTQKSRSVSIAADDRRNKEHTTLGARSHLEEELPCRASLKFIQGGKASTKPTRAAASSLSQHEEDTRPWADRYAPTTLDELAVHKKKVDDVRRWLQDVLEGRSRKRMLILKGASGTGKTATLSLLSQALNVDILEWHNPTASELSTGYVSVLGQFDDFINRGGRFASLEILSGPNHQEVPLTNEERQPSLPNGKKIMLVEEFPNTFMSSSAPLQAFRAVIQQYLAQHMSYWNHGPQNTAGQPNQVIPLVLIISETVIGSSSSADNFTVHRLLGPEILSHPAISQIDFNPVARTILKKALDLALSKNARACGRRKVPGPSLLEKLGEIGDIRSALASLEFLCLREKDRDDWSGNIAMGKTKKNIRDTVPLTKMEKESLQVVTQREASLGMFHAVGKVVYNKRDEVLESDTSLRLLAQPPSYLSQHVRKSRSQVAVDELMDQTGTDIQTFTSALHENYILSCYGTSPEESLDIVNGCIDCLSDSDLLGAGSDGRSFGSRSRGEATSGAGKDNLRQGEICFQTAVRGILFSLPSPVKRGQPLLPTQGSRRRTEATGRKGDAHKMFYPAALKLWRQREEIEGVVDIWVKRFNEGLRTPSCNLQSKAALTASESSKTHFTVASATSSTNTLPCSGFSGRSEMTLERLPYMGKILKSRSLPSSTQILEIEKVTTFRGVGIENEEISDFEDQLSEDSLLDEKRVKHGVVNAKHIQNVRRMGDQSILQTEADSLRLSSATDEQAEKLVLTDDDIEDDD